MSIGIAIAVPDGVALAADTQTTWHRSQLKAKAKSGEEFELAEPIRIPVGWSRMARKLFSAGFNGLSCAVLTAGESQVNQKSMYALLRSAAHKYNGNSDVGAVGEYLAGFVREELAKQFGCAIDELAEKPVKVCELILATYEEGDVARPVVENHLIYSGTLTFNNKPNSSGYIRKWSNREQKSRYGGCWIGRAEFVTHIVKHKNKALPPLSGQYNLMTLADAAAYTRFLVEFTCDFQRFAVMVPDCGRPIISATLTPEGYQENVVD